MSVNSSASGERVGFCDLSQDADAERLARFGLPMLRTPEDVAQWLGVPVGTLAWLTHRCDEANRPASPRTSHYHYSWVRKVSGGWRLIEAPKRRLRDAQEQILREILDRVPPHSAAHGFVTGRSIISNAEPHAGQRVVVSFDLENFFPTVTFSRVVAVFRSLGYSREAAIWLGRLTTTRTPVALEHPQGEAWQVERHRVRHLPQGAPTSPALANLSAFSLDLRLAGLARTFHAEYTRYADDLTFSGPERFLRALRVFIPLVRKIVRAERLRLNMAKRRVMRDNQQQRVTGAVVNERVNVPRRDFDRLKATLTNCVRRGPSTQNHERRPDFQAHLRGRIAHVEQLNPARGAKLLALFDQIDWHA
jgi:hypothetical protein